MDRPMNQRNNGVPQEPTMIMMSKRIEHRLPIPPQHAQHPLVDDQTWEAWRHIYRAHWPWSDATRAGTAPPRCPLCSTAYPCRTVERAVKVLGVELPPVEQLHAQALARTPVTALSLTAS
jgi:hypothetical protein